MTSKAAGKNGISDLKGKVNVLSAIIMSGHEAFDKKDISSLALHIVNASRPILRCARSAFVDMRAHSPKLLAVTGQNEVNPNSEYSEKIRILSNALKGVDKSGELNEDLLKEAKASGQAFKALEYFREDAGNKIYFIPMRLSGGTSSAEDLFFWAVEFPKGESAFYEKLLVLLSRSYSQALCHMLKDGGKSIISGMLHKGRRVSPLKLALACVVVFVFLAFIVSVHQTASADFEIIPSVDHISHAPFDGTIKSSGFENGSMVKKNSLILKYDADELLFELAEAQKEYEEISAELDRIRQKSFADNQELGKVQLLALRKEKKKISIDRIKWRLGRMNLKAQNDGILVIEDPEEMSGKAVRAGDKLFEVLSPKNLIAKVLLNEKDSSVLNKNSLVSLYLHTKPETSISGKIISVTPKPLLVENGQFCYVIKTNLKGQPSDIICGMRGIARVKGKKVSLAYFLFRNLVLWWRKI